MVVGVSEFPQLDVNRTPARRDVDKLRALQAASDGVSTVAIPLITDTHMCVPVCSVPVPCGLCMPAPARVCLLCLCAAMIVYRGKRPRSCPLPGCRYHSLAHAPRHPRPTPLVCCMATPSPLSQVHRPHLLLWCVRRRRPCPC